MLFTLSFLWVQKDQSHQAAAGYYQLYKRGSDGKLNNLQRSRITYGMGCGL